MDKIKISTFQCGTMNVSPYLGDIKKNNPFSKRITLPVNAYLIEHPVHGKILLDTGWSEDVKEILPKYLYELYRPEISKEETLVYQLSKMGIKPEDIDVLILSHLDVDHTCALKDFARKVKRIICAELEYFYAGRSVYKARQVWDTWMPYEKIIERIHYRASVLGPTGRGFDLFGDDNILCIYCPGHTDGIFSMIVSRGASNRFIDHGDGKYGGNFALFATDVAFSQSNIDELSVPGYGFNRQLQKQSIEFLKQVQADKNCAVTLFSHAASSEKTIVI